MMTFFIVYVCLSTLLIVLLSKGQKETFLFKWSIVIFIPIIGWFLPSIWPKRWMNNDANFFADYLHEELNVISVEEALIVNDFNTRRKVMIDILKQDAMQFIDVLKTAVVNDDSETSHYAVTAVIEVKRELTMLLQKLAVQFNQNEHDINIATTYAEVVQAYLRSGFLDTQSMKQYNTLYAQIVERLIAHDAATEQHFVNKMNTVIYLKNISDAQLTIERFKQAYPHSEQPYISAMNFYFDLRSFEKLVTELEQLKASPITLSTQAMKVVRYWNEVIQQHETVTGK